MPDISIELDKRCAALYQKGVTILRTADGNFEQMPWEKVYREMTQLFDGCCVPYKWSFGFLEYVALWKDKEGRTYAATGYAHTPSDAPFRKDVIKPIYFEELTPKQAKKLVDEASSKKNQRGTVIRSFCD